MAFREWPPSRILLLSIGWIFAIFALLGWLFFTSVAEAERSGGVGAFSFALGESATLLLGPPLLLWVLWRSLRRRSGG